MAIRTATLAMGVFVITLGVIGIFFGETTIEGALNVDKMMDITRIILGGFLISGALKSEESTRTMLSVFGIAFVSIFMIGLTSPTIFGILPHGLGWLDQLLHLGLGTAAMMMATSTDYSHSHSV